MTRKGFTLIELMVVVLIVGILAAASIPLMRGRIDSAKWAEANATAGTIKSAIRVYYAENGKGLTGSLGDAANQSALGFTKADLTGTYFVPSDYTIDSVDANGNAQVTVKGSQSNAPSGSKTLKADGTWQ
ncbi:MAG: type II secretion system protein [Sedimentisphaerales bacterium]|nr:type II secretion system protein [Sedimentisphaerales bacterium]